MAVNGIEIKPGQKWRTRGGWEVFVEGIDNDPEYPVNCSDGCRRTLIGRELLHKLSRFDFFKLIEDAPAAAPRTTTESFAPTLRDEFAKAALAALIGHEGKDDINRGAKAVPTLAKWAYEYADAMLEARTKVPESPKPIEATLDPAPEPAKPALDRCPGNLPKCKWVDSSNGPGQVCITCGDTIPF
ncbi:hypothetical protein PSQ40_04755 [Curvibacter sp. HBC61]|uniref:Uncharacterized protein n=1 Tax=Curvibacter cyanobacteriorum TaxID=3026422 RepID=A0ABT5MVE8_9BURK|nr:hypothetical protein [Curvibacter sp. HBC61]MDD0837875.1 hypothetical protein [Curvibacter sp. HBC61]